MEERCGSPPWLRADLIDQAVDHISVAEAVAVYSNEMGQSF